MYNSFIPLSNNNNTTINNQTTNQISLKLNNEELEQLTNKLKMLNIDDKEINKIVKKLKTIKKEPHAYEKCQNYIQNNGLFGFILNQIVNDGNNSINYNCKRNKRKIIKVMEEKNKVQIAKMLLKNEKDHLDLLKMLTQKNQLTKETAIIMNGQLQQRQNKFINLIKNGGGRAEGGPGLVRGPLGRGGRGGGGGARGARGRGFVGGARGAGGFGDGARAESPVHGGPDEVVGNNEPDEY